MVRKTAPKRKAKALSTALQKKQQRAEAKNEQIFEKALSKYELTHTESDRLYILSMLEQNVGWVKPLANLIRSGAFNNLLRPKNEELPGGEAEKWRGRARKLVDVPSAVKVDMLNVTLKHPPPNPAPAWLDVAFMVQFWISEATPLPEHIDSKGSPSPDMWKETFNKIESEFLTKDRDAKKKPKQDASRDSQPKYTS